MIQGQVIHMGKDSRSGSREMKKEGKMAITSPIII